MPILTCEDCGRDVRVQDGQIILQCDGQSGSHLVGQDGQRPRQRRCSSPDADAPPAPQSVRLSIVALTCNQKKYAQGMVESLRQNAGCEYELIVVDNGGTDGSAEWLQAQGVKVIRNETNVGIAPAWNQGLRQATGDVLMVLNDDVEIHEGGMRRLRDAAWAAGIAGQTGGVVFDGLWRMGGSVTDARMAQYVEGYALAFRRDVWESVGEFDELFATAYCEDSDWCMRAKVMGYSWRLVEGVLHHYGQRTTRHMQLSDQMLANQERLKAKHKPNGLGKAFHVNRNHAVGDVIMALAAVRGLRRKYPLSWISFSCLTGLYPLASLCHDAYNALTDRRGGDYTYVELDGVYEEAQKRGDFRHPTVIFCERMGVDPPLDYVKFEVSDKAREWARRKIRNQKSEIKNPVVLCGLRSCTRHWVNWTEAAWRGVVRAFPDVTFVCVDPAVCPPFGHDGVTVKDFWNEPNVLDLTGETDAEQLLALCEVCDAALTVDTGALHFAAAMVTPMVVLNACRTPQACLPYNVPALCVSAATPDCLTPVYGRHGQGEACLQNVTVEQVVKALKALLRR